MGGIKVTLEYWSQKKETKRYPDGGYYESQDITLFHEKDISADSDIEIFEIFYKMNNRLRYCNGSDYRFKDPEWQLKYKEWLNSEDYKKKSFHLYYGNGVVD
jgi:hypothetical protein